MKSIQKPATGDQYFDIRNPNSSLSWDSNITFNIGNKDDVGLLSIFNTLEIELGLEVIKDFNSLQEGDFVDNLSDNKNINYWIGAYPKTSLN